MKRTLLVSLLLVGACADAHLGDVYGRRSRAAFDAQQGGKGEAVLFDGADGKLATLRHHNTPTQPGGQQGGATLSIPLSTSSSSSGSSSMTGGPSTGAPPGGGIRLDAVR
jgi:hypothetical protein